MMSVGSLFSGVGGLELGLERAGFGPVLFQVENNPFCRSVLEKLWREFRRIVEAIAPAAVLVENVTSGARRWLPHVRRDLHLLGYRTCAFALSAADVGAPHLRRRVFVVAADPKRFELRDESGWRGGSNREGSGEPGDDGSTRNAAEVGDAMHVGREGPEGQGNGPQPAAGGWWASEPDVARVVDGLSGGVDGRIRRNRIRALGNAVVPQCAETIGRVMNAMLSNREGVEK